MSDHAPEPAPHLVATDLVVADHAARAAVADDLTTTLFVGAGAGSGKTTALVGRIVRLVVTGTAPIRSIAAITFTEAAAAELRDRVREALERRAGGEAVSGAGPGGAEAAPSPAEAELAAAALEELDLAAISTLHGFAQRVLVAHAVEAGLPPRLTVADELSSLVAFQERWITFLTTLLADPEGEDTVVRARLCGVTIEHLRTIAGAFNQNWDLVADHEPPDLGPPLPIEGTHLRSLLADAAAHIPTCSADDDKLLEHLRALAPFTEVAAATPDGLALLRLLHDAPKLSSRLGRAGNWPDVDAVRDLLARAEAEKERITNAVGRDALDRVVIALRGLTLAAVEERRRQGTLEFHDLLVRARDLLRTHPEVCEALRTRWSHLLVDEFQDTDPIQAELALRIAGHPPDASAAWRAYEITPGSLFFVGDPKQAIYRFRRADIALYLGLQTVVGDQGRRLELTRCFRSVPDIVTWVNDTFDHLIGEGDTDRQPPYQALTAVRPTRDTEAVVVLGGALTKEDAGSIADVRALAADDIARTILTALHDRWPVGDDDRPLRLADIAILVPTGTEVPALETALEAHGIPYRLEVTSLVFETTEVADLLNGLRAVADPGDQLAVVAALRSSLYACGDDDLVRWHQAGGRWDHTVAPPSAAAEAAPAVAEAFDHLRSLHAELPTTDPAATVERLLADRRLLAASLDLPRARDVWRRLRWVADQARAYVEGGGTDLRGWLSWMDALASGDVRMREVVLPDTDDDAVRMLTVHGSKGLEFPFVVLAGLMATRRNPSGARVEWTATGPELAVTKELATRGFEGAAARAEELEAYERLRLLYVAATRAEDHLIVPLHHHAGTACHAATLTDLLDDDAFAGPWRHLDPPTDPPPPELAPPATGPLASPDEVRQQVTAQHAALERARRPRTVSATAVARAADHAHADRAHADRARADEPGTDEAATEEPAPDRPVWRRGRGGTSLGRAVHGTLQLIDLATHEGLGELARFQAEAEDVADQARDVERLVRHALATDAVAQATRHRHWREAYVAIPVGDQVLEGFIDLLVEGPDGFTVIDYKTAIGASDATLAGRTEANTVQAAAYAHAVEVLTGRPVVRAAFVYLRDDGAVVHDVADLRAAIDAVPRQVAGVPAPPSPNALSESSTG